TRIAHCILNSSIPSEVGSVCCANR
ncbi:mutS domain II family protein, partial [Vibrio parahaemolyticus 10296]